MGFVYKLTPQISAFIIDQKRNEPKATCQAISGMILSRFGERVSKSSVHYLLKQAHVITTRPRKVKEKFEIPSSKKEEISKALAPFASMGLLEKKPVEVKASQTLPIVKEEIKPEIVKPIKTVGDIFLKCALYDLSFKPVLGINDYEDIDSLDDHKLRFEWGYLTGLVEAIKIELEDGSVFDLDPRFQGLAQSNNPQLSTPIERAACEVADYILNNIKPLIIRECDTNLLESKLYSFISCMTNQEGQRIRKVALMDQNQKALAEFNHPLISTRYFIIGLDSKAKQFQWFVESELKESQWQLPQSGKTAPELRILRLKDKIIVTNLYQKTYEEIIDLFVQRHPSGELKLTEIAFNQPKGFKAKLQERARMFFPGNFSHGSMEEVQKLIGFEENVVDEKKETRAICTHLQVASSSPFLKALKQAVSNINGLDIVNYNSKKIILALDIVSD